MTRVIVLEGNVKCGECPLSISVGSVSTSAMICTVSGNSVHHYNRCVEGEDLDEFIDSQGKVKDLEKEVSRLEDRVENLTTERDDLAATLEERNEPETN